MPYVTQTIRKKVDPIVALMDKIRIAANGDLNYILYKYCKYYYPQSYNKLKNFCGELRQCATEIERRLLAPYENKKIRENGDV